MLHKVFIGLGSNLGDSVRTLELAIADLQSHPQIRVSKCSSLYQSAPIDCGKQPDFINAVCALETTLTPKQLLKKLLEVEQRFGRERGQGIQPRTLDCDLLLFDKLQITEDGLEIPHPRMHRRRFVLEPLLELTGNIDIPYYGSLHSLLANCSDQRLAKWQN